PDGAQDPFVRAALLRLFAGTAGSPRAARADRLGAGRTRGRRVAVRPDVPDPAGPPRRRVAGGGQPPGCSPGQAQGGGGMRPDQYTESRLQRMLAEDERVAEQGIRVVRLEESRLALVGEVESAERRTMIERVVAEAFPDMDI